MDIKKIKNALKVLGISIYDDFTEADIDNKYLDLASKYNMDKDKYYDELNDLEESYIFLIQEYDTIQKTIEDENIKTDRLYNPIVEDNNRSESKILVNFLKSIYSIFVYIIVHILIVFDFLSTYLAIFIPVNFVFILGIEDDYIGLTIPLIVTLVLYIIALLISSNEKQFGMSFEYITEKYHYSKDSFNIFFYSFGISVLFVYELIYIGLSFGIYFSFKSIITNDFTVLNTLSLFIIFFVLFILKKDIRDKRDNYNLH